MSMAKYTVAVAGATGYAGGEALRILAAHPDFDITCVAGHSSVGESMAKHMPHIPQLANLVVEDTTPEVLNGHDVIILALPHGASGKLASQLDPNAVVVDLGADHRLEEQAAWDEFYGGDFYEHWTYGMPELITGKAADGSYTRQRAALPGTKRIAGPGCNVTATTLALQPGIAEGLVESQDIVADLVVGYSGAGKNLKRTDLLAAEALHAAPAETLVFEDSLYALKTAKAAGFYTIGVYDADGETDQAGLQMAADLYVRDLHEAKATLL